jgi:hypothetical protein
MRLVPTEAPAKFSDLEWSIVAMAQSDSLATLREPSRFWSMVNAIFGVKPANRLANDRLEALRRVAVLAWRYRWNVPTSELKAFFSAGFSEAQYEQLQSRISAVRASSARRTAR